MSGFRTQKFAGSPAVAMLVRNVALPKRSFDAVPTAGSNWFSRPTNVVFVQFVPV